MRHPARWIALGIGVALAAMGVVLATQVGTDPRADTTSSPLVGRSAPAFSVQTLDGETLSRDRLLGKVVVVNFWNTWCIPCRQEHDALTRFYARHAGDADFVMLAVVRDDTTRAVRSYQDETADPWVIALDPRSSASLAFGTRGQPETYVLTPDGLVAGAQIGPTTVDALERMLQAARGAPS